VLHTGQERESGIRRGGSGKGMGVTEKRRGGVPLRRGDGCDR
jgi:hypothetical protein